MSTQGTPVYFTRNRAKVLAVQNINENLPPPDSEITIPGPLGECESTRRELEYSGGSDEEYPEDRSVDSLEVTDTSANTHLKSVLGNVSQKLELHMNQVCLGEPESDGGTLKKLVRVNLCEMDNSDPTATTELGQGDNNNNLSRFTLTR